MKLGLILCVAGIAASAACAAPEAAGLDGNAPSDLVRAATCTREQQAEAVERMVNAPIVPQKKIAGLDLFGGGVTIDSLEATACQAHIFDGEDGEVTASWGPADEFVVNYDKKTNLVTTWQIGVGYRGTLDFASRPVSLSDPKKPNPFGQHTYSIGAGRQILRDGQAWELNWKKACGAGITDCWEQQATEMFDAIMYTFAPDLPSTQTNCVQEQVCLGRSFDDTALFGVRPISVYFAVFAAANEAQPAPSTPTFLYGFTKPPVVPPPPPSERVSLTR